MLPALKIYAPGTDDETVLRLRAETWGDDHPHNDPLFYKWLFQSNPAGSGSGIIYEKAGKIKGFAGLSPRKMQYGDQTILVSHGLDYMVHPDARARLYGIRIATTWVEHATELGYAFSIVFPNNNSLRILTSTKVGFKAVLSPVLMVRPLPAIRFRESIFRFAPPPLLTLFAKLLGLYCSAKDFLFNGRNSSKSIVSFDEFDQRFDALWDEVKEDFKVATVRDATYLNWRYCKNPVYKYEKTSYECNNMPRSFIVTSQRTLFGLAATLIVDGLAHDGSPSGLNRLITHAARKAGDAGQDIITALAVKGSPFYHTLSQAGFVPVPNKLNPKLFYLSVHDNGNSFDLANQPNNWYFTWGDMDAV